MTDISEEGAEFFFKVRSSEISMSFYWTRRPYVSKVISVLFIFSVVRTSYPANGSIAGDSNTVCVFVSLNSVGRKDDFDYIYNIYECYKITQII